jgi:hypothetical protein
VADQQTCSNCGGQLPVGALFCTQCGTRFTDAAAAAPAATTPVATEAPDTTASPSPTVAAPPPAPRPAPEAPAAAAAAGTDATRIVTPQSDPTQTLPTAPAEAPTPAPAPEAPGAWQPAPPPPAPTWGSATTAPPTQAAPAAAPLAPTPPPAPAAPGTWDQPTQAPTGPPPAGPPPAAYAAPAAAAGYAAAPDAYTQPGAPAPGGAAAPAKVRRKNPVAALLAVLGGGALIVAAFLPWYRAHLADGSIVAVSGWNASNDAKTVLGLGVAALLFSLLVVAGIGNTLMRLLYFAGFVASAAVLGYDYYDIHQRLPKNADVIAKGITQIDVGLGIAVGLGGSVLLLLVALTIRRKPKVKPTGFTPPAAA